MNLRGNIHEEKILYTAHMISTAHSGWETVTYLLNQAKREYRSIKAKGQEDIRLLGDDGSPSKMDHMVNFRTRTNNGGLGEG